MPPRLPVTGILGRERRVDIISPSITNSTRSVVMAMTMLTMPATWSRGPCPADTYLATLLTDGLTL